MTTADVRAAGIVETLTAVASVLQDDAAELEDMAEGWEAAGDASAAAADAKTAEVTRAKVAQLLSLAQELQGIGY